MGWLSLLTRCCLSKSGAVVERAHLISAVTSSWERYFDFTHTRALKPASHKYVLPKGTNRFRAHSEISGYSSLVPDQTSSTATRECNPWCILSYERSISWSTAVAGRSTAPTSQWHGSLTQSNSDISKSKKSVASWHFRWLHISFVEHLSTLLSFKTWLIWGKGVKFAFERLFFPLCEFPPESINMTTHLHDILVFSLHACVKFVWFSKDVLYICKEARFVRVTQKVDKISVCSTSVENGLFLSLKKKAPIHYFLTTTVPLCETVHFHSETPCWRIVLQTDVCAEDVAWCGSPWLRPAAACLWWAHSVL